MMITREFERKYNEMKLSYKNLVNANVDLVDENKNLKEEIERLNEGIKELDNMIYETFRISQNGYYSISEWVLKEFTDKIKELEGSDK